MQSYILTSVLPAQEEHLALEFNRGGLDFCIRTWQNSFQDITSILAACHVFAVSSVNLVVVVVVVVEVVVVVVVGGGGGGGGGGGRGGGGGGGVAAKAAAVVVVRTVVVVDVVLMVVMMVAEKTPSDFLSAIVSFFSRCTIRQCWLAPGEKPEPD